MLLWSDRVRRAGMGRMQGNQWGTKTKAQMDERMHSCQPWPILRGFRGEYAVNLLWMWRICLLVPLLSTHGCPSVLLPLSVFADVSVLIRCIYVLLGLLMCLFFLPIFMRMYVSVCMSVNLSSAAIFWQFHDLSCSYRCHDTLLGNQWKLLNTVIYTPVIEWCIQNWNCPKYIFFLDPKVVDDIKCSFNLASWNCITIQIF